MEYAGWSGGWRYRAGAIGGWVLFLAALFGIVYGRANGWPVPVLFALAAVPVAAAGLQFIAAYRSVTGEDEFVRALTAKRLIAAGGIAMTLVIGWSVGQMVGLPYVPAWVIYPLFWGLYGIVTPFIQDSRA